MHNVSQYGNMFLKIQIAGFDQMMLVFPGGLWSDISLSGICLILGNKNIT